MCLLTLIPSLRAERHYGTYSGQHHLGINAVTSESRQTVRKSFDGRGWVQMHIHGIATLVPCTISDVSSGGARLQFRSAKDTPEHFSLLLSPTAQTSKPCRVVWRTRDAIGVEFLG
jgi:hypothetical protein